MSASRKRPSYFSLYVTLVAKDLRHELRTHEMLTSMGLYAVLVLIVLGVAFSQSAQGANVQSMAGGLVWVLVVFTSLLGLAHAFAHEREASCIEGLLLVPMDRSVLFLSKFTSNLLFLLVVEVVVLPLFYFFFMSSAQVPETFLLSAIPMVLGSIGLSAVGTLLSSITAGARGKDVLLAILFVPLVFPLLYACVAACTACLTGVTEWQETFRIGLVLAGAYDVVMSLASWVLYDFVISN